MRPPEKSFIPRTHWQGLLTRPSTLFYDPAWRWRRIESLAGSRDHLPAAIRRRDPSFAAGFDFLRHRQAHGLRSAADRTARRVPVEHPSTQPSCDILLPMPARLRHVAAACSLWAEHESADDRHLVEALLIANADVESIARHVERPTEVIRLYEALFYDVRDLLSSPALVNLVLLRANERPCPVLTDCGLLLKWIAVGGNAEAVLRFARADSPLEPDDVAMIATIIRKQAAMKALEAGAIMPTDHRGAIAALDQFVRWFPALARRGTEGMPASDDSRMFAWMTGVRSMAEQLLEELPPAVGQGTGRG